MSGLLETMTASDHDELEAIYCTLPAELRHTVRSNLAIASLLQARPGMPNPELQRVTFAKLLERLEAP